MAEKAPSRAESVEGAVAALPADDFHVVGIGASAGGLSALRRLLERVPDSPGMAFVVVMHLSPRHESHLVELLQPFTKMPVQQVTRTMALEPNHVFVIPPNANLSTIDTHLRLSELEEHRLERAPIDNFLRTLAATHDGSAIGVVLTGAGSDGALGIRLVREHGGLTIAQDPREAEYDSMPRNAIATGMVDLVLPLQDIPREIQRFCATQPRLPVPDGNDDVDAEHHDVLKAILAELRRHAGQDAAVYKRSMLLNRIRRRMQLHHVRTLGEYLTVLRTQPKEPRALSDDLLLTVAEYFRDPELSACLERHVLPELFERKSDRIRVWSIGCSTGEEAYSLAIMLLEEAARRRSPPQLQVFASDLSQDALRKAREGVYPEEIASTVSEARLERFFTREDTHYTVRREVRDIVVFASHNLFKDPPYAHLDVIVCRNLLRDLQPEVRRGVLSLFHYALAPNGVLLVAPEDPVDDQHMFVIEDEDARLFRRRPGAAPPLQFPAMLRPFEPGRAERERMRDLREARETRETRDRAPGRPRPDFFALHMHAMERHVQPSVLVDAENEVVHFSSTAGRYVRIPGGELTRDIVRLVEEPLAAPLEAGLEAVRSDGTPWTTGPTTLEAHGRTRRVVLRIEPVPSDELAGLLLVVFDEIGSAETVSGDDETASEAVVRLQSELEAMGRRLHDVLETHRQDRRRLAATTFDLQAANDELRSALEELESSKEELQAVNEELTTLDQENRRRVQELAQLSGDLEHLLESTGIATLFVGRNLEIVRYTPQLGELVQVRQIDVGRRISDLTRRLRYLDLEDDVRRVLDGLEPVEREVAATNGRWFLARILPYRVQPDQVDGAVITFIDITERKRAEEILCEADRRKDRFLAMLAHELRNPLAPITSGIELLKATGGNPSVVKQVAAKMERQAKQLVRLVDDLLEVSRISGGRLQLRRSLVSLADVVGDAVDAVRPLVDQCGHELAVTLPDEPVILDADPARLTQVLANLLNNAARYTPQGGRIGLHAERSGDTVRVVVRDNGTGIPDELLAQVFEMFYQGNASNNAGLGIGLTIAKSLAEMHGGTIAVTSRGHDRGTEFILTLPAADGTAAAVSTQESGRSGAAIGKHRVLVVDDNVDAAETLSLLLQTLGDNEVHTASSGPKALETAAAVHPEIVLLDLQMPEMDGYEVARRMRREAWGKDLMLVALTGWGQEEHKRRTAAAGFDRHLTKPVDGKAITALLKDAGRADRH